MTFWRKIKRSELMWCGKKWIKLATFKPKPIQNPWAFHKNNDCDAFIKSIEFKQKWNSFEKKMLQKNRWQRKKKSSIPSYGMLCVQTAQAYRRFYRFESDKMYVMQSQNYVCRRTDRHACVFFFFFSFIHWMVELENENCFSIFATLLILNPSTKRKKNYIICDDFVFHSNGLMRELYLYVHCACCIFRLYYHRFEKKNRLNGVNSWLRSIHVGKHRENSNNDENCVLFFALSHLFTDVSRLICF